VENGVKLLMRYHRFRYRRTRFTSLLQVNQSLEDCVKRINERRHTRFGVSRRERFEALEKAALKPLPQTEFDGGEWKSAILHPDCYLSVEGDYYSAPHIHRHKKLRIKLTENQVEIFWDLERLAIHPRSRHKMGKRVKIDEHFPANSVAYYETTPQKLLSQSRFIHPDLNALFVELFNADVYGHLSRAQGFVRACTKEINNAGHEAASVHIAAATPPCAATTAIACRTSRICSPKRENKPYPPGLTARSCVARATPCCVTPAVLCRPPTPTLLFPPSTRRV
jgi:hypothetical protein